MSLPNLPNTALVHFNNHTQTFRGCSMYPTHIVGDGITRSLSVTATNVFTNLSPGIYEVIIGDDIYYFDLYIAVGPYDKLKINNPYDVYAIVGLHKYPILLYQKEQIHADNSVVKLNNTVNDFLSMILITGKSVKANSTLSSISKITIGTNSTNLVPDTYSEIDLKNNIKALPSGISDYFILNAEQQQCHIIYNIGRKVFTGGEDWQFIPESSGNTYLYYLHDESCKISNNGNDVLCSMLPSHNGSDMIPSGGVDASSNGICLGNSEENQGFYIRILKALIEADPEDMVRPFRNKLFGMLTDGTPAITEYALSESRYRTVLIDEYHIDTFYNTTFVSTNETKRVSYFYKTLHPSRR